MSAAPGRAATPLPHRRCPRCGGPNDCAPAATGRFDVPCWCTQVRVDPALIAALPADARGCACLCRRCLESAAATTPARGDD
jgi:hypothetical protein